MQVPLAKHDHEPRTRVPLRIPARSIFKPAGVIEYYLPSNTAKGRLRRIALCRICNSMQVIRDCFGHLVRLTDERLEHILEHAEMAGMDGEIERVFKRQLRCDYRAPMITSGYSTSSMRKPEWVGKMVVCGGKVST